jgi:hypothetical protein
LEDSNQSSGLTDEQAATDLLLRQLLGTAIADRYADFCRLASGALPLTVSRPLAGHALRELDSLIRHVLAVPMDAVALDDPEQKKLRRKARLTLRKMGYDDPAIQRAGDALKPRYSHKSQIQRIVERLGLSPDGDIAKLWISLNDAFGHVHERSFHESLKVDDSFRAEYAYRFDTVIRQLLAQLQGRYAALMQRTKEIAGMHPAQGVKLFISEIPGAVQLHGYFYDNLQSEEWLPWLAKEGLLAEPLPDPQVVNVLRLWTWPVGRYLIRMAASSSPATRRAVGDAIRALKSSNHPDVHHFGMDVVEALPAVEAAELVDVICKWLTPNNSPYTAAPHKIIAKLAKANLSEPALRMVQSLFQLFENEGKLAAFFEVAMYEHYVNEAVAHLAKSAPLDALPVFCELLRQASLIDRRFTGLNEEDHTYYSIGSLAAEQRAGQDIHGTLILSIMRLAKAAVKTDPRSAVHIHQILEVYKARIYRRVQLHILAQAPSEAPELAESYLTDPDLLDSDWCRDEYAELARAWFPSLAPAKQKIILDAVDTIPEKFLDRWKDAYEQQEGAPPKQDNEREYRAVTIRDLLWGWKDVLSAERRKELDAIVNEVGDPSAWRNRYFAQDKSPLSRTSIQTQPLNDTIAYLYSWRPDPGLQTHTVGALSNELRESAAADPVLFSANADKFGHLRPLFIRRMLEGIRQPAVNGSKIDWDPLQTLTKIVLERSKSPLDSSDILPGDDADWSLTLGVVTDVLAARLRRGIQATEFENADAVRPLVLQLYAQIARLPKPDTDRFDAKHPYFSAEQTNIGASIELCILLLHWLGIDPASEIGKAPREALSRQPELRVIFETTLRDRSVVGRIARAIFGRHLGSLCYFGEAWVRHQLPALFPDDNEELREATWIAHLQSDSGPVGPLLDELIPCYAKHIVRLGDSPSTNLEMSDNRLSEYLMVLYLWDMLPEELLEQFWYFAPAAIRRHAMWFMGRQLAETNEENKARARLYWERRLQMAIKASDPAPYRRELGTIGQWFLWKVDDAWLMDQLLTMLNSGFAPNDGLGVVDKLAEHISDEIDKVIEITKALVRCREMDSWILVSQADSLRRILLEGKNSVSVKTRDGVKEIVSFLSSRGNTGFLDLA